MTRPADLPTIYPAQIDPDGALEQWRDRVHVAEEWQYLIVKAGKTAIKSDMDAMLMQRFGLDAYGARGISNQVTKGLPGEPRPWTIHNGKALWTADRPEPEVQP